MLPLLVFVASCTAGDLTDSSEPGTALLEEAGAVAAVAGDKGEGRRKNRSKDTGGWTAIVISPETAAVQVGATQKFTAAAKLSDGSTTVAHVTWTSTGGTIDANGVYTGGTAGTHRVIAKSTYTNLADTAVVTVSASTPDLASISVSPSSVTLASGATQRFVASGKSRDGATVDPSVTWTATGGTVANDGVYTAGQTAGVFRVIAKASGSTLADTAAVTITAPSEPPPSIAGCPSSGYRRVVNVAGSAALGSALYAAQPGDQIQLAPGTYSGTVTISRRGTATDSITLCGPATAIVAGAVNVTDASYWRLQGFQVKGGWLGLQVRRSVRNRISGLEIHSVGYSGIKLTEGSSYNVVTGNWIHHTGKTAPQYGEGVYVGEGQSSATSAQRVADYNVIEGNRFGPYVTAEHFDVKLGTQGNVVRGNSHDATGFRLIWTNGLVAALGIADGSNQRVEGNTVVNLTYSDPNNWGVFRTYAGSGTVVTRNVVTGPVSARRFYDRDHASGTAVKCDNVKPSGLAWGTTCSP